MPTLKQLTCSLELGHCGTRLAEYGTKMQDGGVEVFVVAPEADLPFQLHLTSVGYIAPGLAAHVYVDGEYQCNRNRQRLPEPSPGIDPREYEVDFRFRQKEEKTSGGDFIGRDWTFAKLHTANADNADNAPNNNTNHAQNVGTIEVVVLRCKDASMHLPVLDTQSYIATPGLPSPASIKISMPQVTSKHKPVSETKKPVSKVPSQVPTKASSKKASAAGDDMMGGMFGLFDGAGDEPDLPYRVPGRYVDQTPLAGYRWDTRSGAYRYHQADDPFVERRGRGKSRDPSRAPYVRDRYEQKAFTVHGGRSFDNHQPSSLPPIRPTTAADRYGLPLSSPQGRYGSQQYRRIPLHMTADPPQQPARNQIGGREPPEGFSFVLEMCKQIDDIYRTAHEVRKKAEGLRQESEMYRNDPDLHLATIKALRVKEADIESFHVEVGALLAVVFSRMRRMDRDAWYYTRDYLVVELRLVDPEHPELREWQDQKLRSQDPPSSHPSGRPQDQRKDSWREIGQGEAGVPLWQMKQQNQQQSIEPQGSQTGPQPEQRKPASLQGNNDNWVAPVDAIDEGSGGNGGWGDQKSHMSQIKSQGGSPYNSNQKGDQQQHGVGSGNDYQKDRTQKENTNNWGDKKASQKGDNAEQPGGWAMNNESARGGDQQQQNNWGSQQNGGSKKSAKNGWNNSATPGDAGRNDDARSRSHKSKINNWNDGGKGEDDRFSSTRLEPVIKSYWADWDRQAESSTRPRPRARDPYQYPAPPKPVLPSGRSTYLDYGVATGRGANYTHSTFKPLYLDTMEKPYAVFTFKYRSKSALEKILNRQIDTSEVQKAIQEAERDKLLRMPKDELVQQMVKMKLAAKPPPSRSNKAPSAKLASNACGDKPQGKPPTNQWTGDQANDQVGSQNWAVAEDGVNNNGNAGWVSDQSKGNNKSPKASSKQQQAGAWDGNDNNAAAGGGGGDDWNKGQSVTPQHFGGQELQNTRGGPQEQKGWAAARW